MRRAYSTPGQPVLEYLHSVGDGFHLRAVSRAVQPPRRSRMADTGRRSTQDGELRLLPLRPRHTARSAQGQAGASQAGVSRAGVNEAVSVS